MCDSSASHVVVTYVNFSPHSNLFFVSKIRFVGLLCDSSCCGDVREFFSALKVFFRFKYSLRRSSLKNHSLVQKFASALCGDAANSLVVANYPLTFEFFFADNTHFGFSEICTRTLHGGWYVWPATRLIAGAWCLLRLFSALSLMVDGVCWACALWVRQQ